MEDDDMKEGAVVPCSRPAGGSHEYTHIEKEIIDRLLQKGVGEVVLDRPAFHEQLHRHFERLPLSYAINVNVDKAEDVLLHRRILDACVDPDNRPVFHVRYLHSLHCIDDQVVDYSEDNPWGSLTSTSRDVAIIRLHEIIISTFDRPKLLSQMSALLSEVGLNIREAHVFSTSDGFCLHIFVVDGWDIEETDYLLQILKEHAARNYVR